MAKLLGLDDVAQVSSEDDVADALLALGVQPAASFGESSPLLSVQRRTEQNEDIFWIFNPSQHDVAVTASLATRGTPYELDLWNGTIGRVAQWRQRDGRVSMPLAIAAHATTALMFQHQGPPLHVTATTAEGASYDGTTLVLRDTRGGAKDVSLSDGSSQTLHMATPPAPIDVGDWQLVVDEISPTGSVKHNVSLPELKDWREIPELKDAVGSGTYTASPDLPASLLNADTDVLIDVGGVAGAMQLSVNGVLVTKQTTPGGTWSIAKLLKPGSNEISVRLDTTLLNRVSASSGDSSATAPSGLLGPVRLIPVALARIQQSQP